MRMIFCSDFWDSLRPDFAYETEVAAAEKLGISYSLISFEALVEQRNALRAVRRVEPATEGELAIYRGWMLKPEAYQHLYNALAEKDLHLINIPASYSHCHYLPESYAVIEGFTPISTWLRTGSDVMMDTVMEKLSIFGDKPVIVKDFVKSRKHEWSEACFIPSASDRRAVERVVTRFLQLQGEDLNEGLVFREFVELDALTTHSKSGMPLTKEFRLFFLDGRIIFCTEYWEEGDYKGIIPPMDTFRAIAQNVQSRFFTMDVARRVDGNWIIVELGDAQVAGLPAKADVEAFYQALSSYNKP